MHIFIIGSRGYKSNYGGWETFTTKLVDNYQDKKTIFHVSGLSCDNKRDIKINNNLYVDNFNIKTNSMAKMFICTIKAFYYYLSYIKENKLKHTYLYVLGFKLGPILALERLRIKHLGIKVLVNPDGLEHRRSKWNYIVKKCFLLSEWSMLNNCDVIICDAKGIKKYIDNKYPHLNNITKYIAYGTDKIDLSNIDEDDILKKYNLRKNKYLLMVGRFVPENNYELVINSYLKSKIKLPLIIVSNISSSKYYSLLTNKLKIDDRRVHFIDGIYDEVSLAVVRKNAYAYIHGHSVGGTNPSLLESLSLTKLNILYNVCFNRDVGRNSCLYFKDEERLVNILDNISKYDRNMLGKRAKDIVSKYFTWDIIVSKYKNIFK